MKLLLLHGPAIASSRLKLNQLRQSFNPESVTAFSEGSGIQDILGSIQTLPMFSEERVIILENPSEELSLESDDQSLTVIVWFDHEVSDKKEILKSAKLKGSQILFFPEGREVSVFLLLDLLASKDKRSYLELNKLKKAGFDHQYLITMVFYMLRSLVSPNKNAPDFVKRKIARQRQNFSDDEIKKLYRYVLEMDFKIKSGLVEGPQAEFLLVNKFIN